MPNTVQMNGTNSASRGSASPIELFSGPEDTKIKAFNDSINRLLSIKEMCISWLLPVSLFDQESFHEGPRD
jgi:hypothetical protein